MSDKLNTEKADIETIFSKKVKDKIHASPFP